MKQNKRTAFPETKGIQQAALRSKRQRIIVRAFCSNMHWCTRDTHGEIKQEGQNLTTNTIIIDYRKWGKLQCAAFSLSLGAADCVVQPAAAAVASALQQHARPLHQPLAEIA